MAPGVRGGADRQCPDQFNAADFCFCKRNCSFWGVVCMCVCLCAHKMFCFMSAPDALSEWINFSPQDCQSNIMAKTKLKKELCREEELKYLSIIYIFYLY